MKIIEEALVVEQSDKTDEPKRLIIKYGCKLGEVIDKLPHGIIHKNHTGIGATTLELTCKRNSIIVEPLKATASTKSNGTPDVLYVGSETKLHPLGVTPDQIKAYIREERIKYKKFIVVVNSLKMLLGIIGQDNFVNYFLMVDESDSVQLESNFRSTPMEECIQYYKLFSPENRCLVTATPIKHNDPVLTNEPTTIFAYDKSEIKNIELVKTDNVIFSALSMIEGIRLDDPESKIVVAYNSINGVIELADKLVKDYEFDADTIRILCGNGNKERVSDYFAELESSEWPGLINLITSAYYTGFDITERYHLIIIIDGFSNCISPNRFKQISGRCRESDGLYSERFIQRYIPPKVGNKTPQELIVKATQGVAAVDCLTTTLKLGDWQNEIETIKDGLLESLTDNGYQIVQVNAEGRPSISYLAIDAIIEVQGTINKYYSSNDALAEGLKSDGINVQIIKEWYDEPAKKKTKKELIEGIKPLLVRAAGSIYGRVIGKVYTRREDEVLHLMRKFRRKVDAEQLISKLAEAYASPNSKIFNTLSQRLEFFAGKYSLGLKLALKEYLPENKNAYKEEILDKVNKVLEAIDPTKEIMRPKNNKQANTLFNQWVESTSATRDSTKKLFRKIKNHNPEGFIPYKEEE